MLGRRATVAAVLILLAVGAAACGGGDDSRGGAVPILQLNTSTTRGSASATEVDGTTPAVDGGVTGGDATGTTGTTRAGGGSTGGGTTGGSTGAGTATGGSTGPSAADQRSQDADLIMGLYADLTSAWSRSTDEGIRAEVDRGYPGFGPTYERCRAEIADGAKVAYVVDRATIQPADYWLLPVGPQAGTKPQGRTYLLHVSITDGSGTTPADIHATVIDGRAYSFPNCGLG